MEKIVNIQVICFIKYYICLKKLFQDYLLILIDRIYKIMYISKIINYIQYLFFFIFQIKYVRIYFDFEILFKFLYGFIKVGFLMKEFYVILGLEL